ncbi:MAG: hypothetical protein KDB80_04915 [Planctomycetes bacterium]|nr:hypothetical protein [Planctomycetota bacterium]
MLVRCVVASSLLVVLGHAQTVGAFERSQVGCPTPRLPAIFELFDVGTFDLDGVTLAFVPGPENSYSVVPGFAPRPYGGGVSLPTFSGDDTVRGPFFLGFPFPYAGGTTIAIDVCSNGYVYLEPGSISSPRCCDGFAGLSSFLADSPSIAGLGTDLDVTAGGQIWFDSDASGAWVTWDDVPEDGGSLGNTFQIQLRTDGTFILSWIQCPFATRSALVGYSEGGGLAVPDAVDLSADVPLLFTGPFGDPISISSFDVPTLGQTMQIDVTNLPASTSLVSMLFGTTAVDLDLGTIGATTCRLYTNATIGALTVPFAGPAGSLSLAVPMAPGIVGVDFELQAAVLAPGTTQLGLLTSNRGTLRVGDLSPITVVAEGANSFNSDTSQGFWRVTNGDGNPDILAVRFDWTLANPASPQIFDANQTAMSDRFDGGNSALPTCGHTYRNGSHLTTGLMFSGTSVSPCDPTAMTGWVGSNGSAANQDWRTLDFAFTDFNAGETFEVDIDTDGGGQNGSAMAGLVVIVILADQTVRVGELVAETTERSIARF